MHAYKSNRSWRWRPALSVLAALACCVGAASEASQDEVSSSGVPYSLAPFSLPMSVFEMVVHARELDFKALRAISTFNRGEESKRILINKTEMITANKLFYNEARSTAVAMGHVEVVQGNNIVLADRVIYNQRTDEVRASGNVSILRASGEVEFYNNVVLSKKIREGVVKEFCAHFKNNTQFAAREVQKITLASALPAQQNAIKSKVDPVVLASTVGWLDDPKNLKVSSVVTASTEPVQQVERKTTEQPAVNSSSVVIGWLDAPQNTGTKFTDAPVEVMTSQAEPEKALSLLSPASGMVQKTVPAQPATAEVTAVESTVPAPAQDNSETLAQNTSFSPLVPLQDHPLTQDNAPVIADNSVFAYSRRDPVLVTTAMPFIPVTSTSDMQVDPTTGNASTLMPLAIPTPQTVTAAPLPSAPALVQQTLTATVPTASPVVPASTPKQQAAAPLPVPVIPMRQTIAAPPLQSVPALMQPTLTATVPIAAPPANGPQLSVQTKQIVDKLPPEKSAVEGRANNGPVSIDRTSKNPMEDETEIKKHDGIGIQITVERPKMNVNRMLENAYDDLVAGDQQDAIEIYQAVLKAQPRNTLALFGLATTYHRAGQLEMARPLYGKLLAIDPQNKEGLNNFLVLIADESPQEALTELEKLQHTHPDFSPIPAQIALIHEKLGDHRKAAETMAHAIDLSPANIKYRYDMAIILDKGGFFQEAADYYQQLVTAYLRGEKIPAKIEDIQERLTFIRSNKQGM